LSKDEVVYDFLSENVGIGEIVGLFEALVFEPSDVEDGRVSIDVTDSSF
jgi:hypothetical protein